MEFSEAFRTEDISKTDFFDFVVTPEEMSEMGNLVLQNNFSSWSRKSTGLFTNNNNSNANNANSNGPPENEALELRGIKETNNNHLLSSNSTPTDSLPSFGDHAFWNTSASAKAAAAAVNVKMEGPSLEELNDICWSGAQESEQKQGSNQRPTTCEKGGGGTHDANTDGAIYTLTVVNGAEPGGGGGGANPTWYRPPDLGNILKDDEDHLRQAMSSIDSSSQYHTSLDIESIISILPSLPMSTDSQSESLYDQDAFHEDQHNIFNSTNDTPGDVLTSDLLGATTKLPQHSNCDDSGFVESKEDIQNRLKQNTDLEESANRSSQSNGNCTPVFNENNNDWTFSNNENRHNAESLLRSALQGGKSFMNQYNGCAQQPQQQQATENKTLKCLDTHTELQSVYPSSTETKTPPDHSSLGLYMTNDVDGPAMGMSNSHIIPVTMDNGTVLMFDDTGGGNNLMYDNSQASSTSQSIDDILLSPLDDYEKLKMIENEVAESAKRYSGMEHHVNGLAHAPSPYANVPISGLAMHEPLPQPHSSTTPKPPKKKSTKKTSDRTAGSRGSHNPKSSSSSISSLPNSTNGVRRERSLHHCTICSKAFKDKYSVNVHIRTHTGEKPFACSVCGKSFRQKAHLAKHYHTHIVQKATEPLGPGKPISTKNR